MSMRDIERAIVLALREKLENRKLRLKDLYEFKNAPIDDPRSDELVAEVDAFGMHWWAAVPKNADFRGMPVGSRGRKWPPARIGGRS